MERRETNTDQTLSQYHQRNMLYQRVSHILSNAASIDDGVNGALAAIGESLHVGRVYVFENAPDSDEACSNTFEWCAEGVSHELQQMQNFVYDAYDYRKLFTQDRFFCCSDICQTQEPLRSVLQSQGIKALMNYAFYDNGRFAGFIGIDDCLHTAPYWLQSAQIRDMLTFLFDLLSMYLIKERNLQKALAAEAVAIDSSKKLERALQEAKSAADQNAEFLALVNELVNTGIWYLYLDKDGHPAQVHWSNAFRQVLGFESEKDFPNLVASWIGRLHPEDRDMVLNAYWSSMGGHDEIQMKYRMMTKRGSYEWFSVRGKFIRFENGRPRMIFGTLANITELETERTDLNGRLDAMLGGVNGGLKISYNTEHYPFAYISESVAAIQGYTPEELMVASGGTAVSNGHPEDIARIGGSTLEEFLATGTYSTKYRVRHKNGNWVWIHDYGTLVRTPQGEEYIYSLIQNIDEEERTKAQLETERKAYKNALMKGSMMHYVVDLTEGYLCDEITFGGKVVLHADQETVRRTSFEDQLNYSLNHGVVLLNAESKDVYSRESILERFAEGQTQLEFHSHNIIDDTYMRILVLLHQKDENGHVFATYIHSDETEQKRAEIEQRRQLEAALETAKQASKTKSVFLSNMSHDIRTPMSAITGYTDLAMECLDDRERVRDYLNKIDISANHMLALLNQILEISRYEFGKMQIREDPVSLPKLIRDINIIIEADIGLRQLRLVPGRMQICHTNVLCDELRLKQILLNCLTNAVKFTPAHGTVSWDVTETERAEPGWANFVFRVSDTGIGMSPDFVKRIFEPFTREQTSAVSSTPGTGLGMTITKELVELMGGSISAKSEKNKGSEFTICLPFRLPDCESAAPCAEEQFTPHGILRGLNILLAEDNPLNREIAAELLTREGACVAQAADGAEAVEKLRTADISRYDLILMDLQMPVMNGYEATRAIRAMESPLEPGIPIIALSANAFAEDVQRAYDAGMNAHVTKPINMDAVSAAVAAVLCRAAAGARSGI